MSILQQLSSQIGSRSEYANRKAALRCLDEPELLDEIAAGLNGQDAALAGDCAEVMTLVAEQRPGWVVPFAPRLAGLLGCKTPRVRWESVHALALAASHDPGIIAQLLPTLAEMLRSDPSIIVRDYAAEAAATYAGYNAAAAEEALPVLLEALYGWGGRHAARAMRGLGLAAELLPSRRGAIREQAEQFSHSDRAYIRKAARQLLARLAALPAG